MLPKRWLILTLTLIVLSVGTVAGVNAAVDLYGLYRPVHGKALSPLGDPRIAKFLLAQRYVPENFNAVLSGASIVANWPVADIRALRVYNVGLSGSNIVEEGAVIEQALARPGIEVALLLVHPAMTSSHEFHTVQMTPELRESALGSASLWSAYKDWMNIRLGRRQPEFDVAGSEVGMQLHTEMNLHMKELWDAPDFYVDSVAMKRYRALADTLRAHHVRIVFVVPPTAATLLKGKREALDRYIERVHEDLDRGDLWINFMSMPDSIRSADDANFADGVHLYPDAAKRVVAQLDSVLGQWQVDGKLETVSTRQ